MPARVETTQEMGVLAGNIASVPFPIRGPVGVRVKHGASRTGEDVSPSVQGKDPCLGEAGRGSLWGQERVRYRNNKTGLR